MRRRRSAAAAALLLPAVAAGALAAAQPGAASDRQRLVGRWLVEDSAEEDGGRLVRMSRSSGGYRLEYRIAFWRGNDGRIQGVSVERAGCGNEAPIDPDLIVHESEIRALLAAGLADCGASPERIRAALRGLEPAYALARAWDREAAAATAAEAAAIAGYGAEEVTVAEGPCDAAVDSAEVRDGAAMNVAEAAAC